MENAGCKLVTAAVGWVRAKPSVTCAVVGASRTDQLRESLAAAGQILPAEPVAGRDELTHALRFGDAPW